MREDLYKVTGTIYVHHDQPCDCSGKHRNDTHPINTHVLACDEYEAARRVLDDHARRIGAKPRRCCSWVEVPAVTNIDHMRRERADLAAWNAGEPIRS